MGNNYRNAQPGGRINKKVRAWVLARHPQCQLAFEGICTGRSTDVDHVIAVSDGGSDHHTNLRGVCHECHLHHSAKHARAKQLRPVNTHRRDLSKPVYLAGGPAFELPEPPGIKIQRERAEQQRREWAERMAQEAAEYGDEGDTTGER
ncbi:HNH endonuclease [Mycolicibacterium farcinogenes]|uniref:HNH endonuclease n=1 Tax=Mycolicibacterium farcinogenes TaxID=1802 RepID=UPI001FD32620|nr:HNH endonuclease signature motif containing protein [Mycolicibacterium farcinogenes]